MVLTVKLPVRRLSHSVIKLVNLDMGYQIIRLPCRRRPPPAATHTCAWVDMHTQFFSEKAMKWTPTITARDVGPLLLISLHQSYCSQDYIVKLASCHIPDELSPRTLVISPWVRDSVRTQVAQISHLGAHMAEVNPSIGNLLIVPRNSSQTWDSTAPGDSVVHKSVFTDIYDTFIWATPSSKLGPKNNKYIEYLLSLLPNMIRRQKVSCLNGSCVF